ncbi:putative photosynthetic complex assembly protein 2 [Rhodobium orientis]|uniref:putative photosynthetic complex assembly protein PuhE n=1 Tax=Rhodobium orientis TaxID=34017 RepID=UPI0014742B6D|nr:putative photosynthetic complex assembly protein PuhE [Rhodobium orientis]MBB4303318.1 putative photosynthetic complex assembly protein 2 [Rhodobium orientis]
MVQYVAPVVFVVFTWWFSTGVVLYAARRPRGFRRGAMVVATLIAGLAVFGLYESARMESAAGAYLGYLSAIGLWAWHELSFLTGMVTGPNRAPCPPDASGWRRFLAAFSTIRDHEVALAVTAVLVAGLTWTAPNHAGLWTFLILWAMRLSAKLTVFLGAPNAINEMTPARLHYLTSYFRTDRTNPFFPAMVGVAMVVCGWLIANAYAADEPHVVAATVLASAFLALAIIEHFFLVLPVSEAVLWRWAIPERGEAAPIDLTAANGSAWQGFESRFSGKTSIHRRRLEAAPDHDAP